MKHNNIITKCQSFSSIIRAIQDNNLPVIRQIAEQKSHLRDQEGRTVLMHVALIGTTEACKILIPSQATAIDSTGCTALIFAAERGHSEIVKLLVQYEARRQDYNGVTALMVAARNGHTECVKVLLPYEVKLIDNSHGTALMSAALNNHIDIVRLLVVKESRMQMADGVSALMMAAQSGGIEICKLLMDKEAGLQSKNGWTALSFACYRKNYPIVQLLKHKEARISDKNGITSLMRAAHSGCVQSVECLLKEECNLKDNRGRTALMYAADSGQLACAKLLARYEVGQQDTLGRTALMIAGDRNCMEIVELLLAGEGDLMTKKGETAMTYGRIPHHSTIIGLLKRQSIISGKGVNVKTIKKRISITYRLLHRSMPELLPFFDAFCALATERLDEVTHEHVESTLDDCLSELDRLLDIDTGESLCSVCLDAQPTLVYLPCKHLCVCELCDKLLRVRKCPICTVPIELSFPVNGEPECLEPSSDPATTRKRKTPIKKPLHNFLNTSLASQTNVQPNQSDKARTTLGAGSQPSRRPRQHDIRARTLEQLDQERVPGGHFLQRGLIRAIINDYEEQCRTQSQQSKQSSVVLPPQRTNDSPVVVSTGKTLFDKFTNGELDLDKWPGSSRPQGPNGIGLSLT